MSAESRLPAADARSDLLASLEGYRETCAAWEALSEQEQEGKAYEYYEDGLLESVHALADAAARLLEPAPREPERLCGCGARHDVHVDDPFADQVREASELWEQIDDLGGPEAGTSEVGKLVATFEAITTPSQRAALDPGSGKSMFTAHIAEDGETVTFRTPEGNELPLTLSAGWSSITAALPIVMIDTADEIGANSPVLRVYVNDGAVFDGL